MFEADISVVCVLQLRVTSKLSNEVAVILSVFLSLVTVTDYLA